MVWHELLMGVTTSFGLLGLAWALWIFRNGHFGAFRGVRLLLWTFFWDLMLIGLWDFYIMMTLGWIRPLLLWRIALSHLVICGGIWLFLWDFFQHSGSPRRHAPKKPHQTEGS